MMSDYAPVWPHDEINQIFAGIYVVRGTNITCFEHTKIQHSRNMTILESHGELMLINTVRLDENGLRALDQLGAVKYIVRIGAFHGRDDLFYLDRYQANLLTIATEASAVNSHHHTHYLKHAEVLPMNIGHFFMFADSSPSEGFIYLDNNDGIIITCDSIKNWVEVDRFFSEDTGKTAMANGEIAKARISPIWLQATGVQKTGFEHLLTLKFKHLISAHGDVLKDTAYEDIKNSVEQIN